jgi:hypothetical protein
MRPVPTLLLKSMKELRFVCDWLFFYLLLANQPCSHCFLHDRRAEAAKFQVTRHLGEATCTKVLRGSTTGGTQYKQSPYPAFTAPP